MKNKSKGSEFDKQNSANLEMLLREELDKEAPDQETVLAILEILENRDAEQCRLEQKTEHDKRKTAPNWLRTTAAVIAILVTLSLVIPPVFGAENIVELVGQWTDDLFALLRPGTQNSLKREYVFKTDNPELQKVYDAVKAAGITEPVVPTWIPEGCKIENLVVREMPKGKSISIFLTNESKYIMLYIDPDGEDSSKIFPKDNIDAYLYEVSGCEHYILSNEDAWFAAWLLDERCCTIITNYNEETTRHMVRSIYMEVN